MEGAHVARLRPLAVSASAIDEIFLVFPRKENGLGIDAAPLACTADHKIGIVEDVLVVFFQNAFIAVALIKMERDIDARARPAHRAVQPPQKLIFIDAGRDLRKTAAFIYCRSKMSRTCLRANAA